MSLLGRVLQGIGSALIEKGKEDYEIYKANLLYAREAALKQLEFQHDDAQETTKHQNRLDEISATAGEQRRTDMVQGIIRSRVDEASDKRDLEKAITIKSIDFKNDVALKGLEHKYKLNEGEADDARALNNAITLAGKTVDHWEVTKDGRLMALDKTGHPMTQVQTYGGGFVPHTTGGENFSDMLPSASEPTPAEPQPAGIAPRSGSSSQRTAALAQAGNVYADASQNPEKYKTKYPRMFDAQGNLLPRDEFISRINQSFPGN